MEVVLIDRFAVPEESKVAFWLRYERVQPFSDFARFRRRLRL